MKVLCCAYSPKGDQFATGGLDKTLKIWNASTLEIIKEFDNEGQVWSCTYTPNGQYLISGSDNGTIKIRDTSTFECVKMLDCIDWVLIIMTSSLI